MHIQQNVPLAPYTTFHIGGTADYFTKAQSTDQIIVAVSWAKERNTPFFILGEGANILVGDKGFRGLVIKNEAKKVIRITDILLIAESGITISELIEKTAAMGLSGLEHFAGIPSSLGGALWQNLHFLSTDRSSTVFIGDIVEKAEILRITNLPAGRQGDELQIMNKETVNRNYFNFGYDYSSLHDSQDIVLAVTLRLEKKPKEEILHTIKENLAWRDERHPFEAWKKSAGSVFKKIEGHGAGRLIEKVGLKGTRIGGAEISSQHANFILNTGNATAREVKELIRLAQATIREATGLELETEISFVGEF